VCHGAFSRFTPEPVFIIDVAAPDSPAALPVASIGRTMGKGREPGARIFGNKWKPSLRSCGSCVRERSICT
jgi:hypothetical protein